jgi:hypothetical protein
MEYPENDKPVSPQKVEANRLNAQRSTGPRTEAGKAKAAQNSYKHGFFALRLFPNDKLCAQDGPDYEMVYRGLYSHYAPVGFMEHFWLEKIATEALRLARVLGYGQEVLGWRMPFENHSVDRLLRYESTVSRNFAHAVKNLELLQAQRKAESSQLDQSTDPEPDPATGESEPTPNEPSSTSEEPVVEEPTSARPPGDDLEVPPTERDQTSQHTDNKPLTKTNPEPPPQPTETVPSPAPTTEICRTNSPSSSRSIKKPEDDIADTIDKTERASTDAEPAHQPTETVQSRHARDARRGPSRVWDGS